MKIAFVGKGGSGKSTITAMFIQYLRTRGRQILAVDADVNMNLGSLMGASVPRNKLLSAPGIADSIRRVLAGTNPRLPDSTKFLPTTLPGRGSHIIREIEDPCFDTFAVQLDQDTRLVTVGSYDVAGIGHTCYHSHLFTAENLISHSLTKTFDIVCDMVAGTDAFAYSMFLQFDVLALLVEPTPESCEVCRSYIELARAAGIGEIVRVIANKVVDGHDRDFILKSLDVNPIVTIGNLDFLKRLRQSGSPITSVLEDKAMIEVFSNLDYQARNPSLQEWERYEMIALLHSRLNTKDWVRLAFGDVMGQLDMEWILKEVAR